MSVLVDTGVVLGFLLRKDRLHDAAEALLGPVLDGQAGEGIVTDYIVDEALTFLVGRGATAGDLDKAIAFLVGTAKAPGAFRVLKVDEGDFASALDLVRRHRDRGLSFTDCTSLAVMRSRGIPSIATFDRGFEGLAVRFGQVGGA
jgi:uncharacterized protein